MMRSCKTSIAQPTATIEITLLKPQSFSLQNGVTFGGRYTTVPANAGSVPPQRQGWIYVLGMEELRLLDIDAVTVGGGTGFMEMTKQEPFAILSGALNMHHAIVPINPNGRGQGRLTSGMALDPRLNAGPVEWYLSD
jgi:hypothetical protein